jgi:hypothetical protein
VPSSTVARAGQIRRGAAGQHGREQPAPTPAVRASAGRRRAAAAASAPRPARATRRPARACSSARQRRCARAPRARSCRIGSARASARKRARPRWAWSSPVGSCSQENSGVSAAVLSRTGTGTSSVRCSPATS